MNDELFHYAILFAKTVPLSFVALMPVVNPVGTAIILLGLTDGASDAVRTAIAKRIAINTLVLLTVVLLGGSYLLIFFGISVPIVQVAGGGVLMSMGWGMLNRSDEPATEPQAAGASHAATNPFSKTFYPFTFPVTVGPGVIAVTLTLSAHASHATLAETAAVQAGAFLAIVGVAIVVYVCFAYSNRLAARLGPNGTSVLLRLIAFVVICIGAEISWTGIRTLVLGLRAG